MRTDSRCSGLNLWVPDFSMFIIPVPFHCEGHSIYGLLVFLSEHFICTCAFLNTSFGYVNELLLSE